MLNSIANESFVKYVKECVKSRNQTHMEANNTAVDMLPEFKEMLMNSDVVAGKLIPFINSVASKGNGVEMFRCGMKRRRSKIEILEAKAKKE